MLGHLSIAATDSKHVCDVIAELIDATVVPFKPVDGAYIAFADDDYGTAIEVYPKDVVLKPGNLDDTDVEKQKYQVHHTAEPSQYYPFHFLIECKKTKAETLAIAKREGWHAKEMRRGKLFTVIEFWPENAFMIELLYPEDKEEALAALRSTTFKPKVT